MCFLQWTQMQRVNQQQFHLEAIEMNICLHLLWMEHIQTLGPFFRWKTKECPDKLYAPAIYHSRPRTSGCSHRAFLWLQYTTDSDKCKSHDFRVSVPTEQPVQGRIFFQFISSYGEQSRQLWLLKRCIFPKGNRLLAVERYHFGNDNFTYTHIECVAQPLTMHAIHKLKCPRFMS